MKVGDTYKVYLEVAPGVFEPVADAAVKSIHDEDKQVRLVIPATLVVMDTKIEIDATPAPAPEPSNQHVLLGVDDGNISGDAVTPPVIAQDVQQAVEVASAAPTSAPVGEGTPGQTTPQGTGEITATPVQTPETQQPSVDVAPVDPSAPPVES